MKLGLIAFGNQSGIGYQTKRLAELIRPDRVLYIDSTSFSKNKKQHPEWYESFGGYKVAGFPGNHEVRTFLKGLTHVLCVENPLNYMLTAYAKEMGIKVYIQTNWEFNDFLDKPRLVLPYKFLMPSYWKIKDMEDLFTRERVMYLPPPINPNEFQDARNANFARTGPKKFLHVAGTVAAHDRNGTLDLIQAIQRSTESFDVTITSQHELPPEYIVQHQKIRYRVGSLPEPADLYKDYDALILPRRYGGLCLPMMEGLMAGLPVIMTDISPNKEALPRKWLVPSVYTHAFMARVSIECYSANVQLLADKLDALATMDLEQEKLEAFDLGYQNYSTTVLKDDYKRLWT